MSLPTDLKSHCCLWVSRIGTCPICLEAKMPHWCSDPLKKALWPFKISWVSKDKVIVDKLCHLQSLILECFPVMGQRNSRPVRGL